MAPIAEYLDGNLSSVIDGDIVPRFNDFWGAMGRRRIERVTPEVAERLRAELKTRKAVDLDAPYDAAY